MVESQPQTQINNLKDAAGAAAGKTAVAFREPKEVKLQWKKDIVPLENSQPLHRRFWVWALDKQNQQHTAEKQKVAQEESYKSENCHVASFCTVEEFWAVQSHFRRPIVMPIGTVLHFFVEGVHPLWEDANMKDGGRITVRLPKTHTAMAWEDLLMAFVGEQFTAEDEVLGLVLTLRPKDDSISVWHRSKAPEKVESVKNDMTRLMTMLPDTMRIDQEIFADRASRPTPSHQGGQEGGRGGYFGRGNYRGRGTYRGGRGRGQAGVTNSNDDFTKIERNVNSKTETTTGAQ